MGIDTTTRLAVACLLAGALACAKNSESAKVDEGTAAAQDTTSTTANPPPGYAGMERDTAMKQDSTNAQIDTFLNTQGTGVPTDTQGYGGLEHPDTSGQQRGAAGADTSGMQQPGATGADTSSMQQPGAAGADSSYQPSGATGADTSSMQSDSTVR
jgi:hypothetical protein